MPALIRVAGLVLLLAACGSKTPEPQVVSNAPPDAGAATTPRADGCPATWAEMPKGAACDPAVQTHYCTYDEGNCFCGTDMPCSGVRFSDEQIAEFPVIWQCNETPPQVRADGCPGSPPQGACGQEGQSCTYGDCCVSEYHCDHGQWAMGMASCPP